MTNEAYGSGMLEVIHTFYTPDHRGNSMKYTKKLQVAANSCAPFSSLLTPLKYDSRGSLEVQVNF